MPAGEKEALAAFFKRINDDYRNRARNTEYHDGEVRYDYLRFNCAKSIGAAFKFGAGYRGPRGREREDSIRPANRGRRQREHSDRDGDEAVQGVERAGIRAGRGLYRKYAGSTYVDPHEEDKVAFKDLPNRFPSVLSRDFRKEQGQYEDFDNLFAMYVLYNMGKYSVRIDGETKLLEIDGAQEPHALPRRPPRSPRRAARSDSENFRRRTPFRAQGTGVDEPAGGARF